jgi:hypothetical protein
MKIVFWLLAFGLTVLLFQYVLFKENGEPRQIELPMSVSR